MGFAGALLECARDLINEGVHVRDIIKGYQLSCEHALDRILDLCVWNSIDMNDLNTIKIVIRSALSSKLPQYTNIYVDLVCEAYKLIKGPDVKYDPDYIRVIKIKGGSIFTSKVVHGLVIDRPVLSHCKSKTISDGNNIIKCLV